MICKKCGQEIPANAKVCEHCGVETGAAAIGVELEKPENVVAGIVGAFLGAAIGAVMILVLSRMGRVAAISGVVLAVCTLSGYRLLGGKLTKKGVVIAVAMMVGVPYVADRIDWALVLMEQAQAEGLNWTFNECFQVLPQLLEEEILDKNVYLTNLLMQYVYTAIGVVAYLVSDKKKKKK